MEKIKIKFLFIFLFIFFNFSEGKKTIKSGTNSSIILPKSISFNITINETFLQLNLIKTENINEETITVLTSGGRHWHPSRNESLALYKDEKNDAEFSLTSTKNKSKNNLILFGSFTHLNMTYAVRPYRLKDNSTTNFTVVRILGRRYLVLGEEDKATFENTNIKKKRRTKRAINNRRTNQRASRGRNRGSNRVPNVKPNVPPTGVGGGTGFMNLILEVLVVIDHSLYQKWVGFSDNNGEKAIANLLHYYAQVIGSIDSKYTSIKSRKYSFKVKMPTMYVCKDKGDSSFTEDRQVKFIGGIDYTKALQKFADWIASKGNQFPKFDVAASFTTYKTTGSTAGLGYVGTACAPLRVSITRDEGMYGTANTAAHEIGHNLGSNHDGEGNQCDPNLQYLMTPMHSPGKTSNHHTFSPCSIKYFEDIVDKLRSQGKNCMDPKDVERKHVEIDKYKEFLGKKISVDEQCQHIYGKQSFYCSRGVESDEKICSEMFCNNPQDGKCYMSSTGKALDGTPCGKKKWCLKGKCVSDSKASGNKEKCVHGEMKETINFGYQQVRCKDLEKLKLKSQCKQKSISDLCCETCPRFPRENPNCPYGDEYSNCPTLSHACDQDHIRKGCCDTCGNKRGNRVYTRVG